MVLQIVAQLASPSSPSDCFYLVAGAFVAYYVVFILCRKLRISWYLSRLKSPKGVFLLGHLLEQGKHVDNHYRWKLAMFDDLGDTFAMRVDVLLDGAICTRDPQNIQRILGPANYHNYRKPVMMQHALFNLMRKGIFNINTTNSTWAHQRGLMKNFVGSNVRYEYQRAAVEPTNDLIKLIQADCIDQGKSVDIESLLLQLTTKFTYRLAFGMEVSTMQDDFHILFKQASQLSITRFTQPWYRLFGHFMQSEQQLKLVMTQIDAICKDIIVNKRKALRSGTRPGLDLLSKVLADSTKHENDDELVRDMIITMMLAGRESLASGLMWVLYIVSKHPEVEAKIVDEINKSATQERDYLDMVLRETFRLFPPTPYELKSAVNDDTWPDGTFVPAGTNIEFSAFVMGRNAAVWPEPNRFDPTRWMNRNLSDYANPVFNAGPRACPGQQLAMKQMKYVLYELYTHFTFELVAPLDEPVFVLGIGLFAKGGIQMKARSRN